MHEKTPKIDFGYYEEDEISLKDILSTIREYGKEVLKVKWWIIIFSILPGGALYLYTAQQKQTYTARSTFMLQEHLVNYRIRDPYGVYGETTRVSQFKVIKLSSSKRIMHAALKYTGEVNNVNDLLVNHFLNIYNDEELQKDKLTSQDEKLNYAYNKITKGESLMNLSYGPKTEIYDLSVKTINEALSIQLVNAIYEEIISFYVKKSREKSKFTYDILNNRIDSVTIQLNVAQEQLILSEDKNRNLFSKRYEIKNTKLKQEIKILENIYAGLFKNKETVEFNLSNETPMFQSIDKAVSPITPYKKSKVRAFLMGIFFGGLLSIGFVVLRKMIRDALNPINSKQ